MTLRLASALATTFALLGCSAVVSPDQGRLGGGIDAGELAIDAGRADAGIVIRLDAGPRPDAGPAPDAGPPVECEPGAPRCDGDVRVRCVDGVEQRTDCGTMSAYCAVGACMAWVCTPGERGCSADLSEALRCDDRGVRLDRDDCGDGECDPATAECGDPPPSCDSLPSISPGGTVDVDLCGEDDTTTHQPGEGCPRSSRADSGDRVLRLVITDGGRYRIRVDDVDDGRVVDTVVSIRRDCDARGTQLACGDDSFCVSGPACFERRDQTKAELTVSLEPGTYYVVADAFEYDLGELEIRCGDVRVSVERTFSFP